MTHDQAFCYQSEQALSIGANDNPNQWRLSYASGSGFHPIGWDGGVSFVDQSRRSKAKLIPDCIRQSIENWLRSSKIHVSFLSCCLDFKWVQTLRTLLLHLMMDQLNCGICKNLTAEVSLTSPGRHTPDKVACLPVPRFVKRFSGARMTRQYESESNGKNSKMHQVTLTERLYVQKHTYNKNFSCQKFSQERGRWNDSNSLCFINREEKTFLMPL